MARERKTVDTWELHVNYGYGHGYEHECTEHSWYGGRNRKHEYRENCPQYATKLVKKRVPKSEYSASQLADIEKEKTSEREAYYKRRKLTVA